MVFFLLKQEKTTEILDYKKKEKNGKKDFSTDFHGDSCKLQIYYRAHTHMPSTWSTEYPDTAKPTQQQSQVKWGTTSR